jgi:hypothetical protein
MGLDLRVAEMRQNMVQVDSIGGNRKIDSVSHTMQGKSKVIDCLLIS